MLSTILVPLDGSSLAEQALPFAERLARVAKARVILARVVPPFSAAETTTETSIALTANENLEEIASKLRRAETSVEVAVLSGDASAEIQRSCAARGADLIVMATHGRNGLARVVLGSTTTGTLQHARVPLLIVRPTDLQATETSASERHKALVQG